jgi:hypothetical protein
MVTTSCRVAVKRGFNDRWDAVSAAGFIATGRPFFFATGTPSRFLCRLASFRDFAWSAPWQKIIK